MFFYNSVATGVRVVLQSVDHMLAVLQENFGFDVSAVVYGVKVIYMPVMPAHRKRLTQASVPHLVFYISCLSVFVVDSVKHKFLVTAYFMCRKMFCMFTFFAFFAPS